MEAKSMLSEKGAKLLVINNFKFSKAHVAKCGKIRWRCTNTKSRCNAKLYTGADETSILESALEHNHEPDKTIDRQAVSNSVKRKAVEDLSERPSKIIHKELNNSMWASDIGSDDLARVRQNMYVARRDVLPTLPKNRDEVFEAVMKANPTTKNKSENFVCCLDKESDIIVLSCFTNLCFLCTCDTVYMDGTFQYCTKFFYQLFIIHAFKNGYYVPVIFALLPDKSTNTYFKLFQNVSEKCKAVKLCFNPRNVIIDFEQAIHRAISMFWPSSNITGCRFHLCQAWYRKILNVGLSNEYKDQNSEIGKFLKLFFGIHFLEHTEVGDFFSFELFDKIPNDERVTKFCDYILENYISEEANFPPQIWACTTDSMCRSTNACESFHSLLKRSLYAPHPNIFIFLDLIINIQNETFAKIKSASTSTKKLKSDSKKRQQYIASKIKELQHNKISKFEFVKCLSYYHLPQ